MSTKFTPGPWQVYPGDKPENYRLFVGYDVEGLELEDDHFDICEVSPQGSPAEQVANARLIAAAPDLYEALEECSELTLPQETLERVRAALAKAAPPTA